MSPCLKPDFRMCGRESVCVCVYVCECLREREIGGLVRRWVVAFFRLREDFILLVALAGFFYLEDCMPAKKCVCAYWHIFTCVCVYSCTHTEREYSSKKNVCVHTDTFLRVCVCIHVRIQKENTCQKKMCVCILIHFYVCVCVFMYAYRKRIHVEVRKSVCKYWFVFTCVCVFMYAYRQKMNVDVRKCVCKYWFIFTDSYLHVCVFMYAYRKRMDAEWDVRHEWDMSHMHKSCHI